MAGPKKRNGPRASDKKEAAVRKAKQNLSNSEKQMYEGASAFDRYAGAYKRGKAREELKSAKSMKAGRGVKEDVQTMKGGGIMRGFESPVKKAAKKKK